MIFDAVVIGKGLFGAAATRHLSQMLGSVAVIGPDEPTDPATHQGIFGAHYDEARIIYRLNHSSVWSELAQRSLTQFDILQAQSGLSFHHPVGGLYVVDPKIDGAYPVLAKTLADQFSIPFHHLSPAALQQQFPSLSFPTQCQAVWETAPSGYFNPRQFLQAQLTIAQQSGATIASEIAIALSDKNDLIEIYTESGTCYQARKVLLATGAFSNGFDLLERDLALRLKIEFVVMAEISERDAQRLQSMPTVIYQADSSITQDVYVLPPVRYPDGKYYLKLGANTPADRYVSTLDGICAWYRAGDSDQMLPVLRDTLQARLPDVAFLNCHTHRCVITRTVHGFPYIDALQPGKVYVAVGGNGQGAQAADAIGKLGADLMVNGVWTDTLPAESFRAHFADEAAAWTSRSLLQ